MIISDEQAHLAAEYLQGRSSLPSRASSAAHGRGVPADLLERVKHELEDMPETRGDRIAEARAHLEGLKGDEVAAKMIGRIISDSLR